MEKSYTTIKVGKEEIEIQLLEKTLVFNSTTRTLDLSLEEAEELHTKLGELLGRNPVSYYVDEPTHND